jgi:peroxiredoxin
MDSAPDPQDSYIEMDPVAPRSSMLPIVISLVAGLLVIGLMAAIMVTPRTAAPAPGGAGLASSAITQPPGSGAAGQQLPREGYLAPDFTLNRLDGTPVQLSSFRGVKPVWVNFWATWCPPCRNEMPEMEKLYPTWSAKGVEILGVDVQEPQDKVKPFVEAAGYSWTFALDVDAKVSRQYYVSGIPTHVFIGKDGVIKSLVVSGLDRTRMEAELNKLVTP